MAKALKAPTFVVAGEGSTSRKVNILQQFLNGKKGQSFLENLL